MKHHTIRNTACALVGIATLAVCILACTSFSPDDKKVLYPTFDPQSGAISYSVYDRSSRSSRQVFSIGIKSAFKDKNNILLPRAQWLPDGNRFVATWTVEREGSNHIVGFVVASLDGHEPVRILHLDDLEDYAALYDRLLPVLGTHVFTDTASNLVSLDLISGEVHRQPTPEKFMVFQTSLTNRLGFLREVEDGGLECGLLDPETMTREWQLRATNIESIGSCRCNVKIAFNPRGRQVALGSDPDKGGGPRFTILEVGKPQREIPLPVTKNEKLELGQCAFASKGEMVIAAFALESTNDVDHAVGIIEVPLDGTPPRRTILIENLSCKHDNGVNPAMFFECGLSHDGRTLAVSSAWLAVFGEKLSPKDCALFLVDLSHPAHKVTKVPIPLPSNGISHPE